MNINKKLDRMKQWAGERMGQEVKTNMTDEFKSLEIEMTLRHEGEHISSAGCSTLLISVRQAWTDCSEA